MPPTFYHHWPEPVTEKSGSIPSMTLGKLQWVIIFLILVALGFFVALVVVSVKCNSKACQEGLPAEQECHNVTRLLELQLTQTRKDLLGTMDQAAMCNQTVVNLLASLEMEKTQSLEQLTQKKELQREIEKLEEKLQDTLKEVERLRKEKGVRSQEGKTGFSSSSKVRSPLMVPVCLFLALTALLA